MNGTAVVGASFSGSTATFAGVVAGVATGAGAAPEEAAGAPPVHETIIATNTHGHARVMHGRSQTAACL